jgi:hypothetical protein
MIVATVYLMSAVFAPDPIGLLILLALAVVIAWIGWNVLMCFVGAVRWLRERNRQRRVE